MKCAAEDSCGVISNDASPGAGSEVMVMKQHGVARITTSPQCHGNEPMEFLQFLPDECSG